MAWLARNFDLHHILFRYNHTGMQMKHPFFWVISSYSSAKRLLLMMQVDAHRRFIQSQLLEHIERPLTRFFIYRMKLPPTSKCDR